MPDPIATAADYADAMLTARSAKNWLVALLLLLLVTQLSLFFVARYTNGIIPVDPIRAPTHVWSSLPTTAPSEVLPADVVRRNDVLHYIFSLSAFLALADVLVLNVVLLLIVAIMLVGRLIGVSRVTGAFIACVILTVLLFPWQAFLNSAAMTYNDFKIPGVLYTWDELVRLAKFDSQPLLNAYLAWARFVGLPVIAILLVGWIHTRSNRGLRQALGEAEIEGKSETNTEARPF